MTPGKDVEHTKHGHHLKTGKSRLQNGICFYLAKYKLKP